MIALNVAIPHDLNFRKVFISIYQQFDVIQHDALEDIYSGISADFMSGEALSVVCQRFISGAANTDPSFPLKFSFHDL